MGVALTTTFTKVMMLSLKFSQNPGKCALLAVLTGPCRKARAIEWAGIRWAKRYGGPCNMISLQNLIIFQWVNTSGILYFENVFE